MSVNKTIQAYMEVEENPPLDQGISNHAYTQGETGSHIESKNKNL